MRKYSTIIFSVTSVVDLELAELINCRFLPTFSCGDFILLILGRDHNNP